MRSFLAIWSLQRGALRPAERLDEDNQVEATVAARREESRVAQRVVWARPQPTKLPIVGLSAEERKRVGKMMRLSAGKAQGRLRA